MKQIAPLWISIPVVWALIILVLSTVGIGINLSPSLWDIIGWDKLAHAFVYAVLCFLLIKALEKNGITLRRAIIYSLIISVVYGILMEIIQFTFFPNRYFEIFDIFANIVGAISIPLLFLRQKKLIKE